jgi:hypothetical protein
MRRLLRLLCSLAIVSALPGWPERAHAAEGGGSVYHQGSYGDFAVAMPGPSGLYLRNDMTFYLGGIGPRPLGGRVDAGVDQFVWADVIKLGWVSPFKLFGASYGAAIAVPVVPFVHVEGRAPSEGSDEFSKDPVAGQGDPLAIPLQLNWAIGDHHLNFATAVSIPIGRYSIHRTLNLGRNYWAIDPNVSYTYLNNFGADLSVSAGVLFNFKNPDTDYTTGFELHVDWLAGWHVAPIAAVAINGYWYEQLTDDTGNIPAFLDKGFQGRGVGIGPAAMVSPEFGVRDVTFIAKWTVDISVDNRMRGDLYMLSMALKLL